jgi:hypothetical protein
MGRLSHLVVTSLALPVTVHQEMQEGCPLYHVVWHAIEIGTYSYHSHGARRWCCCLCGLTLREEASIIRHIYQQHQPDGCGERIHYTGDVRTNERKVRMPWRLSAPELDS